MKFEKHAATLARMAMHTSTPDTSLDLCRILTEAATARLLGLSAETLRRMALRGEGPPRLKLSPRRVGYRLRDVQTWVERVNA